ncbi:MAG: TrmB family transcriptional regulator [Thaumarchaeota archaeon]|nr:TrmB family transcriptional regulator [Nitrososphaerota archaeon]MCY3975754.1 TrmB family transcriptional regulator [Nitrososphaerota archaeon]
MNIRLDEFGLSKYESNAYLTLLSQGPLSASDLAYHSGIPRTKIYSTLMKLEKKHLVLISKYKPIICTAISPTNAFNSIIQKQIHKVTNMNKVIDDLKQISLNNKQKLDEKIYHHIDIYNNFFKIQLLFKNVKSTIKVMVDHNGIELLSKCKQHLINLMKNNVKIQILMLPQSINTKQFKIIPNGAKIRISKIIQNCFIFDESEILFLDNKNNISAIFHDDKILNVNMSKIFSNLWDCSYEINSLHDMTTEQAHEIYETMNVINSNHDYIFKFFSSNGLRINLLEYLEKYGIYVSIKPLSEFLDMINSILNITCFGNLYFDPIAKNIILESKINYSLFPWAFLLNDYLQKHEYETKIFYKFDNQKKINIKFSKRL